MKGDPKLTRTLRSLRRFATKDPERTAKKRGVPVEMVMGVPTAEIRRLAKSLGKDSDLAQALWQSGFLEARLLAILIESYATSEVASLHHWVRQIDSWDVCDLFAKEVAKVRNDIDKLVQTWVASEEQYVRRAGFALMANYCARHDVLTEYQVVLFPELINSAATDNRRHVRQSVCWALREIGKMNTEAHELAIMLALDLIDSTDQTRAWVGRCAYKELETLVEIPERRRLITSRSKTAQKHS